jgi:hypothetical protein
VSDSSDSRTEYVVVLVVGDSQLPFDASIETDLLFRVDSRRGTLINLLVVPVVDIHLSLDLTLKLVLQGLRVSLWQCFGWVVFFQQKTILSMNVIPKFLGLLSNTINWIECHIDIGFAKCHIFRSNKICSSGRPPKG